MPVQIQQLEVVSNPATATPPAPRERPAAAEPAGIDEAELERRLRHLEQERARLRAH